MSNAYSFRDCVGSLAGPGGSFSFGAGAGTAEEGVSFEYEGDKDTLTMGSDGTPMHSLHASNAGTVTIHVLKTSPLNAQLQNLYNAQISSASTWGQNTISWADKVRGDKITCTSVAFKKGAALTYAKDANQNEWAFTAGEIDRILGSS